MSNPTVFSAEAPRRKRVTPYVLAAFLVLGAAAFTQGGGFNPEAVALVYHKVSGDTLNVQDVAQRSTTVQGASNFDKPDALKAEVARLRQAVAAANPGSEFTVSVDDAISEYDHARSEFAVNLFLPGGYLPVQAFGQEYQLVFANAEGSRSIPMSKDSARAFDTRLNMAGRRITNEVRFKVIGRGDPAGAVTGTHVIRAELLASRLLDASGQVVYVPRVVPASAVAAAPSAAVASFDLASADVAGLRVGVKAGDLETTLKRLYGPVERSSAKSAGAPFAGSLTVNQMGCDYYPGTRRKDPVPGNVCVTAMYDRDDVVRVVRVERVFPWFDAEVLRAALTKKYGPVADARQTGEYSLGWGPPIDPSLVYLSGGPATALSAYVVQNEDMMTRSLNKLPQLRVVLSLVDPNSTKK